MGPYCKYCDQRCFVPRALRDARSMILATCARGMERDREVCGQDHTTALNPITDEAEVARLHEEVAELAALSTTPEETPA